MNIAFIKFRYVPFGGGEGYLQLLMRECAQRGHGVHLVTSRWPTEEKPPWNVHEVPLRGWTLSAQWRSFGSGVRRTLQQIGCDASLSLERSAPAMVWRAGEGVHAVWLERRKRFDSAWTRFVVRLSQRQRTLLAMERRTATEALCVIANSEMVRRDLEQTYGSRIRSMEVIHNGADDIRFSTQNRAAQRAAVRAEWGIGAEVPLLLFAGSGFRRKGLEETFQALVRTEGPLLAVVGRDDPRPWQRRARELRIESRVRFLPPRQKLDACYHAADATLLPSWFDSFGLVGLESLKCGTPLIASRYAGVHELVKPGVNGRVVDEPDDAAAFSSAVHSLLDPGRISDPEKVADSVKTYTMERNCRMTLDAIERVALPAVTDE